MKLTNQDKELIEKAKDIIVKSGLLILLILVILVVL